MKQVLDKSLLLRLYGVLVVFEIFQILSTSNLMISLIITVVCHATLGMFILLKVIKMELSEKHIVLYLAIIGGTYSLFHAFLLVCQISNKLFGCCLIIIYYVSFVIYFLTKRRVNQKANSEAKDKAVKWLGPGFFVLAGAIGVLSPIKEYFVSPVVANGLLLFISSLYTARFWYQKPIRGNQSGDGSMIDPENN